MNSLACFSFPLLQKLFVMLDAELSEIEDSIENSADPDSDGLLDRSEYFVGIGLVAAQQVLAEAATFARIEKDKAYKLGPRHSPGISYIRAINSAANYWKHEAEWWKDLGTLNNSNFKTRNDVGTIANTAHYQLSNFLFAVSNHKEIRLKYLLPIIEEWLGALKPVGTSLLHSPGKNLGTSDTFNLLYFFCMKSEERNTYLPKTLPMMIVDYGEHYFESNNSLKIFLAWCISTLNSIDGQYFNSKCPEEYASIHSLLYILLEIFPEESLHSSLISSDENIWQEGGIWPILRKLSEESIYKLNSEKCAETPDSFEKLCIETKFAIKINTD